MAESKEEDSVVSRIFRLCAEGVDLRQIAQTLNAEGIKSDKRPVWRIAELRRLLRFHGKENDTSTMGKKIAIYVRVASTLQQDGMSFDTQKAECANLAASKGHQVDAASVYQEVGSGMTLDRPQLTKLRALAAAGELENLIVYNASRLSRNARDFLALVREFEGHGVVVHFAQDSAGFQVGT